MKKLATPVVRFFTFAQAKAEFLADVDKNPCAGQRHHKAQNAAGRQHITNWDAVTTQAVFHAVQVLGKMRGRGKPRLKLIDGYHRLAHWFAAEECPFESIIVIEHTVCANTEEELADRIDELTRTIDSKEAAKTNVERWCAAVRDAGLTDAYSRAYTVGFQSGSFLKRVLLPAKTSMYKLTACAKDDIKVHELMDALFLHSECQMRRSNAREFFHTGVQTALFFGLRKLPVDKHHAAIEQIQDVMVKLDHAHTSKPYMLVHLSAEAEALYSALIYLASPEKKKALRALGNREVFYDAVAKELNPLVEKFVASLARSGKKRIAKAA
ncbi:hypothetical protein [Burkholderia ambifaria]|uniref:hypothetical protein n=1 Tax=Burkholderia ambifaria TaxID=152480 RepID=UPI000F80C984|nr:hypothetical protein [Burkholderia ambifaria]